MKKKMVISLGLVAANIAVMPANAKITENIRMADSDEIKMGRNIDDEDKIMIQSYDENATTLSEVTTPPSVTIPPVSDNDKQEDYSSLVTVISEDGELTTTSGAAVEVSIELKAPSVVYGNPVTRSELSGKVVNKETGEKISGSFSWTEEIKNLTETKEHEWEFTPKNSKYTNTITGEIEVKVRKHDLKAYNISCTELYLGDRLKESKLQGKFVDEFGHEVFGNLVWDSPSQTVIEDAGQFHWTFVPDDLNRNNIVKGSLIVNSKKGDVVTPVVREMHSENIRKLDEFKPVEGVMEDPVTKEVVKGTFKIVNKAPKVYSKNEAEDVEIEWEFTPENTRRYNIAKGTITVKANLRMLKLGAAAGSTIVFGSERYQSIIKGEAIDAVTNELVSGSWRWDESWKSVNNSGSYPVIFIPDIDNVYVKSGGNASVKVVNSNNQQEIEAEVLHTDDILAGGILKNSRIFGKALDKNGKYVKGEFVWMDPSEILEEGAKTAEFLFIPADLEKYKPCSGKAAVNVLKEYSSLKKPQLLDVSATSARSGQMITQSKITGRAEYNGVKVDGKFEWLDKDFRFTKEGVYYDTIKFIPNDLDEYSEAYISVKIKVYNENQIEIENVVLSNKNAVDVQVDKKITVHEAEALKIDGYEIETIELLAPSDTQKMARTVVIDNGYTSSDRVRLTTKQELEGQIRVAVESDSDGNILDDELKPDFTVNVGNNGGSGSTGGNNSGESNGENSGNNSNGNNTGGNSGNSSSGSSIGANSSSGSSGGSSGSSSKKKNNNDIESKENVVIVENSSSDMKDGWNGDKFIKDGKLVTNSWVMVGNEWYFTNSEGSKIKSDWIKYNDTWYYLNENGIMKTGWLNDGVNWYYLNGNGAMKTGWLNDGVNWYYLNGNGVMKTGWLNDGVNWYYLNGNGAMKTGWLKDGANWYYLNGNGAMKTGWFYDSTGEWYYLKSNGEMAVNEYIEGYYLGNTGALK
ncbi:hypothetical protein [uncultured Clostridium sp.]|uniref:hypothetical protein n=1 Tax=uncultured Clostridium sp. TaxID=59620 RepID=UPI0025CBC996|nr:hypothetical protein [uncultured Clostridium sp.]